jgi:hypothetical protein
MSGTSLLRLHCGQEFTIQLSEVLFYQFTAVADDDHDSFGTHGSSVNDDVTYQRATTDLVQHFWSGRFHSGAFARGKHHYY